MFDDQPVAIAVARDTGRRPRLYDLGVARTFQREFDDYRVDALDVDQEVADAQ